MRDGVPSRSGEGAFARASAGSDFGTVAAVAAWHLLVWTLVPALTHRSVPLDVAEAYVWGREWVIATFKHPGMPNWVLEASRVLTGTVGWPAYLVSQLFVAATFLLVFLLGKELVGSKKAAGGTLLLTGIAFYAWPTVEFNHNIAQMPFWAGLPLVLWRATEERKLQWWLLVGLLAAGGLYAKLSTIVLLATLAGWMVWDAKARAQFATPGPWLAAIVGLALALPLAVWLVNHQFAPLTYAASRSQGQNAGIGQFAGDIALNLVGFIALLGAVGLLGRQRAETRDLSEAPIRAIRFLTLITFAPIILVVVAALLSGSGLKAAWGSSMFNYAGVLAVALARERYTSETLRKLIVSAFSIITITAVVYAGVVLAGPFQNGAAMRVNWPQAEISERFVQIWRRETGVPLRLVGGSAWVSDIIALTAPSSPSVLTGRSLADSPWVTPERIAREGLLLVWDARRGTPSKMAARFLDGLIVKEERFRVQRWIKGDEIVIGYAILPPKPK